MSRLHILIISLFTVALGTGIVVGMGMTRAPAARDGRSWLTDQLNLTPEQSQQMKAVWENVRGSSKPRNDARMQYRKERDDALQALLTPEQKAAYAKLVEHYNAEIAELNRQQEAEFQAAAERTKKILNEQQRARYDELLKKGFRGGPGGPGGPRGDHGPGHGPGGPGGDHGPDHGPDGFGGEMHGPASMSQPG
jgi:Spy/CpxP family protein refolding chaperone